MRDSKGRRARRPGPSWRKALALLACLGLVAYLTAVTHQLVGETQGSTAKDDHRDSTNGSAARLLISEGGNRSAEEASSAAQHQSPPGGTVEERLIAGLQPADRRAASSRHGLRLGGLKAQMKSRARESIQLAGNPLAHPPLGDAEKVPRVPRMTDGAANGEASSLHGKDWQSDPWHMTGGAVLEVRDAVSQPKQVVLLFKQSAHLESRHSRVNFSCQFGGKLLTRGLAIENRPGFARCAQPDPEDQEALLGRPVTVILNGSPVMSSASYGGKDSMSRLVYAATRIEKDLLVFVRGLEAPYRRLFKVKHLNHLICHFGKVEVRAKAQCKEGVRCPIPSNRKLLAMVGQKLTIEYEGAMWPSVVELDKGFLENTANAGGSHHQSSFFEPFLGNANHAAASQPNESLESLSKASDVLCLCTMVWNKAHRLGEWVSYHSFMGITQFFIYDNNSDDDIMEVVARLAREYSIFRVPWPWPKSQEASASHTAASAFKFGCDWTLFIDVDEFVFSRALQKDPRVNVSQFENGVSILGGMIRRAQKEWRGGKAKHILEREKMGQIHFNSHNFGPSGKKWEHPDGQVMSYICRERFQFASRVLNNEGKSIHSRGSLDATACNTPHAFQLRKGCKGHNLSMDHGVVNHYKYPIWSEYKLKYLARSPTYQADWSDIGGMPVEPDDYAASHCDVNDTELRDFFEHHFRDRVTTHFPWQHF